MQPSDGETATGPFGTGAVATAPSNAAAVTAELLSQAGRLLLEYNESTAAIRHAIVTTAATLTADPCYVAVVYDGVTVSFADRPPSTRTVRELRFNSALQARVHHILGLVRAGDLPPADALRRLETIEGDTPRHPTLLAAAVLGLGAGSLALILGADVPAALVAGGATALGLAARRMLGRKGCSVVTLPFVATLIGAVFGGLAVRFGWTATPGPALIVPALMVVPGPHIINGLSDMIDNFVPTGSARLALAACLLCAATVGTVLGIKLTLAPWAMERPAGDAGRPTIAAAASLAGVVTAGFAVFYNATWSQVAMAAVGGVAGNGLRGLALDAGLRLDAATLMGGLAVGVISALIARRFREPFAVIAFAGAVTMMPGVSIYRALFAALKLARPGTPSDLTVATELVSQLLEACLVIGSLTFGLLAGARMSALWFRNTVGTDAPSAARTRLRRP